jgi:hypothetical protein
MEISKFPIFNGPFGNWDGCFPGGWPVFFEVFASVRERDQRQTDCA